MNVRRIERGGVRRVALLADTHGSVSAALSGALAAADLIVHAGDVGNAAVLGALAKIAPVVAVAGNNDVRSKWPYADFEALSALPEVLEIALPHGTLVVVHGHQWRAAKTRHQRLRAAWPAARCVVYGHSHRRIVDAEEQPWVVNPGAAGRARAFGGAGWLGLRIGRDGWSVRENGFGA